MYAIGIQYFFISIALDLIGFLLNTPNSQVT